MVRFFVLFFCLTCSSLAFGESKSDSSETGELSVPPIGDPMDPNSKAVKEQTQAISKLLRCFACQGLSVADSKADAAMAMKARVKELLILGYTDEQIFDYFIDVYGEWIMLKPDPKHWILIVAPISVILIGFGVVYGRLKSPVSPSSESSDKAEEEDDREALSDEYRRRILAELEED